MLTDIFNFLRFLCVFLCVFSAYTANAAEAEDWGDNCWEFGPDDYLDDNDEDDQEECRCLWSEEDQAKAAEYDKYVQEIEAAEIEVDLFSGKQSRGLGKWFAKRVKKMFMKFVGLKKVKNLDDMAYQMVRFNRKVGKFVKVPSIDKMIRELSKTDLTPEMLKIISEKLKYYKKHKHAKPQNNKNSRTKSDFEMHPKIIWGSMEIVIGYAMLPFPALNIVGIAMIGAGTGSIYEGVCYYAQNYMDYQKELNNKYKPSAVLYRFNFKNYCPTNEAVFAA